MQRYIPERRKEPRAKLAQLVRIRPLDPHYPAEVCTSVNLSLSGIYFATSLEHYCPGMNVYITRNFRPDDPSNREDAGTVLRVDRLRNGKTGIAVSIVSVQPLAPVGSKGAADCGE
jgi:hypothetical protein